MISDTLIIIDMQNGVCQNDHHFIENLNECVTIINARIATYRSHNKPIIFIQHNDSSLVKDGMAWKVISNIEQKDSDLFIQKTHANSFYKTTLEQTLTDLNIRNIEICGAQTEYCVDSTVKMAHGLGYNLQMPRGGTTTFDNHYMTAKDTIKFYEGIWDNRFLKLLI
ncbi:cysteine hydrolase family protein [Vagococcus hydrophili]|uniref:Cysteine hydrolase n=1 Tax=Vagococcus hydrophili TaxID=2714947 RepID=A0A6G8ASC0_9ENTE|nr:cysteine hydrolase family protein [Vagococcus hydrophili]QIL47971.1 cysteine hydrolase [Vagococcus hydrophili]